MPKLTIDHRKIEVPEGTKVIEAAERLGIMIPRFCYHPALGSVGACRMCAVSFKEGPVKGVQMSCMTDAKDGMVVSTTDEEAVAFRRYVVECLMLNHPHDCPVCDEGGQCLLQDETVSGGHGLRRYLGKKRTYHDQDLGFFVQHEMNRCIHCWRCRRFYQDFAGYTDLGAMQIGHRTYFGRFESGPLESPFSGNLIDLCPTGVYTDKTARFKARRWDLERSPSVCIHCSVGCNTIASARYREMIRLEARVNEAVNGHFICDRGRFAFDYANRPDRPRQPRVDGRQVPWNEAIDAAAQRLGQIVEHVGHSAVALFGSCRSSLETQAALVLFAQASDLPAPRFFWDSLQERKVKSAVRRLDRGSAISMAELARSDFVLVVGADPINEAPMLALALRQAYRNGGTIAVIDPRPVSLPLPFDHLAIAPRHVDLCLDVLVGGALNGEAADSVEERASARSDALLSEYGPDSTLRSRLTGLSARLRASQRPAVVCGTDIVRQTTPAFAADQVDFLRQAKKRAGLFYLLPGANAFGAALLSPPSEPADSIVQAIEDGTVRALLVAESDPFCSINNRESLLRAVEKLELLVVLDYLPSPVAERANVLLPTTTVFEKTSWSFLNQEGRCQQSMPAHGGGLPLSQVGGGSHPPRMFLDQVPGAEPGAAWEALLDLSAALTQAGEASSRQDLHKWLAERIPAFGTMLSSKEGGGGVQALPEASRSLSTMPDHPSVGGQPQSAPAGHLELLLTEWTFGSEEFSAYSNHMQAVEKAPELLMHARDASRLGLSSGDTVSLDLPGGAIHVRLNICDKMAPGVMVLPRHHRLAWQKLAEIPVMLPETGIRKI
jgi:NADH-quinone oxidoreductase subunit G